MGELVVEFKHSSTKHNINSHMKDRDRDSLAVNPKEKMKRRNAFMRARSRAMGSRTARAASTLINVRNESFGSFRPTLPLPLRFHLPRDARPESRLHLPESRWHRAGQGCPSNGQPMTGYPCPDTSVREIATIQPLPARHRLPPWLRRNRTGRADGTHLLRISTRKISSVRRHNPTPWAARLRGPNDLAAASLASE